MRHRTGQTNGKASSNSMNGTQANGLPKPTESTPLRRRLLTYDESIRLVPWQTDNNYILSGYRPQLHNLRSCIYSAIGCESPTGRLITDIHNETVNIHSHSIGAAFFAALLPLHVLAERFPTLGVFPESLPSTSVDKWCMATYFVCACTCLGLSSWFHTVQCHSERVCFLAHCGDYVSWTCE